MKFGPVPAAECAGAILAHSLPQLGFKKGRILTSADAEALSRLGVAQVVAARLEADDLSENEAAARLAAALAGPFVHAGAAFTGRANLYAEAAGLVRLNAAAIDAVNTVDESITIATLSPFEPVQPRAMLATVKIIPYAAPRWAVERAESILAGFPVVEIAPFVSKRVALVSTVTPGLKPELIAKNRRVVQDRLEALGARLIRSESCPHTAEGVADALTGLSADLVLIFGASANADRMDVVPEGIVRAGGTVSHVGMPVDPGNLLVIASLHGTPAVVLPGCARSPKRNGFDWVLERLCADIPVGPRDIMGMGVGGLLKEIPSRPHPRDAPAQSRSPLAPNIAGVVLAAGRSTRMGANKLLAPIAGRAVLIHSLAALQEAGVSPLVLVTGHDREAIGALIPPGVKQVHNPHFTSGMASSLRTGLQALPDDVDAVLVMLGDMPAVRADDIRSLAAAFDPTEGRAAVVPVHAGKRGHPVLFGRVFWPAILQTEGDQGPRQALIDNAEIVCEVAIDHPGVLLDADTPDALETLRTLMTG
jgi:molybdenum cofactor cytidylyltransferase